MMMRHHRLLPHTLVFSLSVASCVSTDWMTRRRTWPNVHIKIEGPTQLNSYNAHIWPCIGVELKKEEEEERANERFEYENI